MFEDRQQSVITGLTVFGETVTSIHFVCHPIINAIIFCTLFHDRTLHNIRYALSMFETGIVNNHNQACRQNVESGSNQSNSPTHSGNPCKCYKNYSIP